MFVERDPALENWSALNYATVDANLQAEMAIASTSDFGFNGLNSRTSIHHGHSNILWNIDAKAKAGTWQSAPDFAKKVNIG